jgi:hypothetical protein
VFLLFQHASGGVSISFDEGTALRRGHGPQVHFDDVGKSGQRLAWIAFEKVIQHDHVAHCLEAIARRDHQIVRRNRFQDFDCDLLGRQQSDVVPDEQVARGVDEG